MPYSTPLTQATQTVYAELLAQLLNGPLSATGLSWFTRKIKGRDYWYMQYTVGGTRRSSYLGPDTEPVRSSVATARDMAARSAHEATTRERLVAQAVAGGMTAVDSASTRVYEVLAQAGVFDAGGVLVGSHAFFALGNLLGVRWSSNAAARTEDLDIARDPNLDILVDPGYHIDLAETLRAADKAFFPVPALDRGKPTTSFKVRGQAFSVSLLAPARGREEFETVPVPVFGASAETVRFLDYLLENIQPAAALTARGVLVRVPSPARFALHKLVVSRRRPAAWQTKAEKDLDQAAAVIEVLRDRRPGDIDLALDAAKHMPPKFMKQLAEGANRLPEPLDDWLLERLP